MNYDIKDIVKLINCKAIINCEYSNIKYILTDSRKLIWPQETIFTAIMTSSGDGHRFISELYSEGVRNFIVSDKYTIKKEFSEANYIISKDPLRTLQQLAAAHRKQFSVPVIGITGSNGKTIVKEWLYQLLRNDYYITRSPKSYNSQIGIPLSVWEMDNNTQLGIFEAGISKVGEMQYAESIICPNIGIFTNLGQAHQEGFESSEQKLKEKLLLFRNSDTLIFRKGYGVENAIKQINPNIKLFSWNMDDENATLNITSINIKLNNTIIGYKYKDVEGSTILPFSDNASIENGIHCLACCLLIGIKTSLENLERISMRLELKQGKNNCLLIDDAYNSDINSLTIALDFLQANAENKYEKRTVIISDLSQTGEIDDILYEKVISLINEKKITRVIGIGDKIAKYWHRFPFESRFFVNANEMLHSNISFQDEIILIKGARKYHLEELVSALELKRHETVMEIDLNALVHNFKKLRSYLKPETKTVAMIKANGYGCGAIEVAQTLSHHHCDYFGVAVADEGVELRQAGIRTNIMIMNPEQSSFGLLLQYRLEPEIYSFNILHAFAEYADKQGVKNFPIHIKIDTGMHRLGFSPEEIDELIKDLSKMPSVKVDSAFSHLAAADDPNMDTFTLNQIDAFMNATDKLRAHLKNPFLRHILNSYGVQRFDKFQFEMVRLGIGLYGIGFNEKSDIKNIVTLKTVILQIKHIKKDETIGYNRKGVLVRDTTIAAIPIGYADGLNRAFGNRNGHAIVNDKPAPFIGNICMDVCMIDITDIPNVKEGDSVTIFGDDLTISDLAQKTHTIPYEILTGISLRVKRVYFQE